MNKIKKEFKNITAPIGSKKIILEKITKRESKSKAFKQIAIGTVLVLSMVISFFLIKSISDNHIKELSASFPLKYESDGTVNWQWPTSEPFVITSFYGYRWGKLHGGIDISGCEFGSPIYSASDGVVVEILSSCPDRGNVNSNCGNKGYGNYIIIETSNKLTILYSHISNNINVSIGQHVKKGDTIGYIASSGSSTGPHLHFEIRDKDNRVLDPCQYAFDC